MMIAVQNPGLVMVLLIVKIRPMAVTLPAMIMMVVTVVALTGGTDGGTDWWNRIL